jgi:hypothetical protein
MHQEVAEALATHTRKHALAAVNLRAKARGYTVTFILHLYAGSTMSSLQLRK